MVGRTAAEGCLFFHHGFLIGIVAIALYALLGWSLLSPDVGASLRQWIKERAYA